MSQHLDDNPTISGQKIKMLPPYANHALYCASQLKKRVLMSLLCSHLTNVCLVQLHLLNRQTETYPHPLPRKDFLLQKLAYWKSLTLSNPSILSKTMISYLYLASIQTTTTLPSLKPRKKNLDMFLLDSSNGGVVGPFQVWACFLKRMLSLL